MSSNGSAPLLQTSPLLVPEGQKRDFAYEIKFLVPAATGDQVLAWARSQLQPDPHADGALGDGYLVQSLYFDTPDFDVFHRKGSYAKAKYRMRRYGTDDGLFLERKLKVSGRVLKRRTLVPPEALLKLKVEAPDPKWEGFWFHRRLLARQLEPKCLIRYSRVARVGITSDGPVRLTVDRDVHCQLVNGLVVPCVDQGLKLLDGQNIVELKYRSTLPALFKTLIADLQLQPQAVSKYRLTIQTCLPDLVKPTEPKPDPSPAAGLEARVENRSKSRLPDSGGSAE
ncbi:MAG: polyphosphate polymerase domain-containing protein [Verrucomicrobiota bacterium]|jgi:hypothetical protein